MQALLKSLGRRRCSRGFGVHSPFAYRFITEVLCLPGEYGYYAYSSAGRDRRMRLLVRLLACFNPVSVAIDLDAGAERVEALVREVLPHAAVNEGKPDFIIADKDLAGFMPCNALILGREAASVLASARAALGHGMTFFNGCDCAVIAALEHLPRQDFELKL